MDAGCGGCDGGGDGVDCDCDDGWVFPCAELTSGIASPSCGGAGGDGGSCSSGGLKAVVELVVMVVVRVATVLLVMVAVVLVVVADVKGGWYDGGGMHLAS